MKPKIECRTVDFSGAVRPDQAQRLALADMEVEIVQDFHLAVAGAQGIDGQERVVVGERRQFLDFRPLLRDLLDLADDILDRDDRIDGAGAVARGRFAARFAAPAAISAPQIASITRWSLRNSSGGPSASNSPWARQ